VLSAREMQALSLIARGFSDREIAALLAVSLSTARKHRENVQRKLGLRKASQLTIYYLEHYAEPCKKNNHPQKARCSVRGKIESCACLPAA
jgi:DNA-binding CsgD family transcriptional regulator